MVSPESDHQANARALRDAKRERLRAIYVDLLASAWAMNDFPMEAQVTLPGESEEDKGARLASWLERANWGADAALVRMALERDATPVKEAYKQAQEAFRLWRQAYRREEWDKETGRLDDLKTAVNWLDRLALAQLAELDRPIPQAPEPPPPAPARPRR